MNEKKKPLTTQTRHKRASRHIGKKLLKFTSWLMLLMVGLIASLVVALNTGVGQRGLITLADKWLDSLSIQKIEGNLKQGLELINASYISEGVDVRFQKIRLQLDLSCLWQKNVCVEDLIVTQPKIIISTAELPPSESEDETSEKLQLPVNIIINHLLANDLSVKVDDMLIKLAHFETAISLTNDHGLTIEPTYIDHLLVETYRDSNDAINETETHENKVNGNEISKLSTTEPSTPIDWQQIKQSLSAVQFNNTNPIILPFDIHIPLLHAENWRYSVKDKNDNKEENIDISLIKVSTDLTEEQFQLQELMVKSTIGELTGNGNIRFSGTAPINLTLNAKLNDVFSEEEFLFPQSELTLNITGLLTQKTELLLTTQGALNTDIALSVFLNKAKTPFELNALVHKVRYPFAHNDNTHINDDELNINQLTLNWQGDLLDSQIKLESDIQGFGIPHAKLNLTAHSTPTTLQLSPLLIDLLNGQIELTGKLDWYAGIKWENILANINQIDSRNEWQDWPAKLSGVIGSSGAIVDDKWDISVPTIQLSGTISQRPFKLEGDIHSTDEMLAQIKNFQLSYGQNNLAIKGMLGQQSNFNARINAPNLSGLLPSLNASINGHISVLGSIDNPQLSIQLNGERIAFEDFKLQKFDITSNIETNDQITGHLSINLANANYQDIRINNLKLWASGNEQQHELHLRSQGDPIALTLNAYGNFDKQSEIWKGIINQNVIQSPIGHWRNNHNIHIHYDNNNVMANISTHCWLDARTQICFPQEFKAGIEGEIPFEIKNLNLTLLKEWLPEQTQFNGLLSSEGKVAWFNDKPFELAINVEGKNLNFSQKIDYRTLSLTIPTFKLNANMDHNLSANAALSLGNQGSIDLNLNVNDLATEKALSGNFNIKQVRLSLFQQLLGKGELVSGVINSNLRFGGDLDNPLLNGLFNLQQLSANISILPFSIKESNLAINFLGNRSTLNGNITTDTGRLNLSGDASWQDLDSWQATVNAKTDRFDLHIPSLATLELAADIEMQATADLLKVAGKVNIPRANIEIEEFPESATEVSDDEVIVSGTSKPLEVVTNNAQGIDIVSDITLNIGNNVKLNAYGLTANLDGILLVQQRGTLGLFGEVNVRNGRYNSFGQDLLIRKGVVSFSGLPSQPLLNIEAIRNPQAMEDSSVTAGVRVTGIAEAPELTLFSEPAFPQDEILSYILTGRSLKNSGDTGSSGSIGASLLSLGLSKSGKLVGGIGESFGIKDLNLDTQGVGDSSQVVVSGSITPRLQIKYGVGLFDSLAELTLRYRLLPNLYLQSISGVSQAVDLLYRFEFD